MRRSTEKAVAISATGHVLLLVLAVQFSQWRPTQRGYPRTITAVLLPKGGGAPEKSNSTSPPAGATVTPPLPQQAEPPQKKTEQPKKETPLPTVRKDQPEKKAPVMTKSPFATASNKNSGKEKADAATSSSASEASNAAKAGGKSGAGSGVGGVARIDGPEFPFPHYLALLQFRIENQWRPAYLGAGQFVATVHFIIAKSGRILSVELEQSSGNFTFDQAAMRAVHNANPLPALPEGASMESLGVHFDFVANW